MDCNIDEPVIGIDLGTRNSCISICKNKRCEIIDDGFGNTTIPSIVAFHGSLKISGHTALSMKDIDPKNTIYDIKRIIGRSYDDPVIEEQKKIVTYSMIKGDNNNIIVELNSPDGRINGKIRYHPEEICAYILREIKRLAEKYLSKTVSKAVITVPAYFNDSQRQATLDAAEIAGLDVIKIINEPTAAALAYGIGMKEWKKTEGLKVVVFDFGAGTLDVSVMNIEEGMFETKAIVGNSHLGGEDIDKCLMDYCILKFEEINNLNAYYDERNLLRLKQSVESAKKILSQNETAYVRIEDFYGGINMQIKITRSKLNELCNPIFLMCMKCLTDSLESSGLGKHEIDEVILVGGSTKIPKISEMILEYFKGTKMNRLTCSMNPDHVVSMGASMYGYIMTNKDSPLSNDIVLTDITPLSLGIETMQNEMSVIIPRNTVIPTTKKKNFTTDTDYQDSVAIKIYEGERKLTKHNKLLGIFELFGFEKQLKGHPVIEVQFHVDVNGILSVSAREKKSDAYNSITLTSSSGAKGRLSRRVIDDIIKEAEANEEMDRKQANKLATKHKLQSICDAIQVNLKDGGFVKTVTDLKIIKKDLKSCLSLLSKSFEEIKHVDLLKKLEYMSKKYAPMIIISNKEDMDFVEMEKDNINAAEIHGDDDTIVKEKFVRFEEEKGYNSISDIKNSISQMCKEIVSIVNSPISNFEEDDREFMMDYIDTVNIWLYTTTSRDYQEYMRKIDEINNITDKIMSKYDQEKIYENNNEISEYDELKLLCNTLRVSIESNSFSVNEKEMIELRSTISNTIKWLESHTNENPSVYRAIIENINDICNKIYHNMSTLPEFNDDSEDDIEMIDVYQNDVYTETIDKLIESMTIKEKQKDSVFIKMDFNIINSAESDCK